MNDLSLYMLLLDDSSPLLNVIALQLCWSWLDRLAADFMKGTKAISALHPLACSHHHHHTPLTQWWDGGLGGRDSGTDGGLGRGVFRGPGHRHSELPWAVETVCQPYCPAAPSFLYPSPTSSSPLCALIEQIVAGGSDVYMHLSAVKLPKTIYFMDFLCLQHYNNKSMYSAA